MLVLSVKAQRSHALRSHRTCAPTGFAIEGPSQAKIECEDQNDGSCNVSYWPTEPGEYAVHVTCDDEDIEHSPFMACIVPDNGGSNADKVREEMTSHLCPF